MPDCAACSLYQLESDGDACLHVNRPGGLALTQQAFDLCDLPPGSSVLDVASGASGTLQYLHEQKRFQVTGVDLSYAMLKSGKDQTQGLNLVQGNCELLPLSSASQQAVLMECALSLSGNLPKTLVEFNRVLRSKGKLLVTDVYVREVFDPRGLACLTATHCLKGTLTEAALRHQVVDNGFMITHWQDQTALLKQWLARMVFKLGSLDAFYRQLVSCEADARSLALGLGTQIKLGYYLMVAQRVN